MRQSFSQNQKSFDDPIHFFRLDAWIITGGMNRGIMRTVGQLIGKNSHTGQPIPLIVSKS